MKNFSNFQNLTTLTKIIFKKTINNILQIKKFLFYNKNN